MSNKGCTFIDDVVTQPLTGSVMRFHARTENDIQYFSMERSTAVKAAYDILREVAEASSRPAGEVVPFERAL